MIPARIPASNRNRMSEGMRFSVGGLLLSDNGAGEGAAPRWKSGWLSNMGSENFADR
jgi:hypothetical protein